MATKVKIKIKDNSELRKENFTAACYDISLKFLEMEFMYVKKH